MKSFLKKIIIFLITTEARLVLRKYKPKIIAVTGSVGKTTTKDAIYIALSTSFYIRKSEKSFNSEIGIPLTILGCQNAWSSAAMWLKNIVEGLALIVLKNHYPKWLIIEVGTGRPGDIKKITRWLKPDVAVLTRFPDVPVHVEFFSSPEAVAEEKLHVVKALESGGTLIINADDKRMKGIAVREGQHIFSFGFGERADISASNLIYTYTDGTIQGMSFRINYDGKSVPAKAEGVVGRQYVYSYLAALAVGMREKISILVMVEALSAHHSPPGRMRLIEGMRHSVIIDDSYNSSPVAAEEALETLKKIEVNPVRSSRGVLNPAFAETDRRSSSRQAVEHSASNGVKGKKIAVLGDMLELGSLSSEAHRSIGEKAAESADTLVTVGIRARDIASGAHKAKLYKKNIVECNDAYEAGERAKELVEEGDIILVKGSQGMRMERVVEAIMAHPERKRELLVRQEDEWLRKS